MAIDPPKYHADRIGEGRRRGRVNDYALWFVLALVSLAPLPLGGAHPSLWAVFAGLAGLGLAAHGSMLMLARLPPALPLRAYRVEALGWMLLILVTVVQIAPLGIWFPLTLSLPGGDAIALHTVSLTPGTGALVALQLAGYGAVAYLAAQLSVRESRARSLLLGLVIIVTAYALYGIVALTQLGDTILGMPKWAYSGSATGPFVNRNTFATFLGIGLVCAVTLFLTDFMATRRAGRALLPSLFIAAPAVIAAGVITIAIILTTSRMGLAAGAVGAAIASLMMASRTKAPSGRLIGLGLMVVALVAVTAWLYGGGVLERLGSVERDFDVRAQLYAQTWELIAARPLLGYGAGSFGYAFPLVHELPVSLDLSWDRAHSTYLSLWAEFGLIGGSLPLLVVAFVSIRLISHIFRSVTVSANAVAALGAIVVCAIHSLVDFSLEIQAVAYLLAVIVGAGVGNSFAHRETASA